MALTTTAAEVYRDFKTDGVPPSGVHEPKKSEIRALLSGYERTIDSFLAGGGYVYSNMAALDADLAKPANSLAWVTEDATAANNGIYRKVGASGAGSWSRTADLPYSFIAAADTGAGTPNAIQATTAIPVSQSALILLNVFEANTASPVTVSFNGGSPLTIKSNSGNDIAPGGLTAGMLVMGRVSGSTFRIVTDQLSAAIVADAEAALVAAEAARDVAVSAAATVKPLPPQGRLTLLSGVAVTEAEIVGATTICYTPAGGNLVPIYNGSSFSPLGFSELSLPLDSDSGHTGYQADGAVHDLFVVSDGGTLRLGTGPSWAAGAFAGSAVARGTGAGSTALTWVGGVALNANAITLRYGNGPSNTLAVAAQRATYVGSFKATANGQATDSKAKRLLFNAFNQVARLLFVKDTTTSWNYNTLAFRQARASSANQVEVLLGLSGSLVHLEALATAANSAAAFQSVMTGIGVDSTTVNSARAGVTSCSNSANAAPYAVYDGNPGQGYHYLTWLERGAGPADNQTWYGTVGDIATGLTGWVVI